MQNVELDLTAMNIFDGLKAMVLSSAERPDCKVKCKGATDDVKSLVASFAVKNLEFV